MKKVISLDFWDTLCKSNPRFKEEQFKIARQYIPGLTFEQFKDKFRAMKAFTNERVESTGIQPHRTECYKNMFPEWNQIIIDEFISYSDMLFLQYPPIAIPKMVETVEKWKESGNLLYVASNTIFIHGEILSKVIFNLFGIVKSNCKFSDEVGLSKPSEAMFTFPHKPNFHVGDNPVTDGACELYGIEFINVDTILDEHKVKVGILETTF